MTGPVFSVSPSEHKPVSQALNTLHHQALFPPAVLVAQTNLITQRQGDASELRTSSCAAASAACGSKARPTDVCPHKKVSFARGQKGETGAAKISTSESQDQTKTRHEGPWLRPPASRHLLRRLPPQRFWRRQVAESPEARR